MDRLGPFRIVAPIGRGGMSDTHVAERTGPAGVVQRVCLKRLRTTEAHDPHWIAMFQTEARVAASLHHQNIVPLFDFGQDDATWWMALQLIDGTDLRALLGYLRNIGQPMPIALAVHIATEVGKALAYAHEKRDDDGAPLHLVHRDVSTSNILVSVDGAVLLTDFGIAKVTHGERTRTGELKGKAPYMAPEYLDGKPIDGRADLFALGVVMFQMLAARMPFDGPTPYAVQQNIARGRRRRLDEVAPEVPRELVEIVERLLARAPDGRMPSADTLVDELARIARHGDAARPLGRMVRTAIAR